MERAAAARLLATGALVLTMCVAPLAVLVWTFRRAAGFETIWHEFHG